MTMKEIINNSQACGYLEKIYSVLNRDKFDGKLDMPVITIQTSVKAYGHVTVNKVWKDSKTERYELNISAEYINRPIENVVATLLHEMVHIYNLDNGIQDTSRGGRYHNKKFKAKAEEVGLIITHDNSIGWSITEPSEELKVYIQNYKWQDIPLFRRGGVRSAGSGKGAKKPSSTRKYTCPCCGQSVRATKKIYIVCGDCNARMISNNDSDNETDYGEGA